MTVSCIYDGVVVHKRLRPHAHALSYRVFWLNLDLDRVFEVASGLRLLSYNRLNAVSVHDADHGQGDATRLADHARATFRSAGLDGACARVSLLSFPRVMGYGFNPISVYVGYDAQGRAAGAIYEVNNTFGERHSYVTPLDPAVPPREVHAHGCEKTLYVSPFTQAKGRYSFRLRTPADKVTLGVMLRDDDGPVLKTHLVAEAVPLNDRNLARRLAALPLMTMKVMAGIHFEAARLWLKGTPLTTKPAGRRYGMSVMPGGGAAGEIARGLPRALPLVPLAGAGLAAVAEGA